MVYLTVYFRLCGLFSASQGRQHAAPRAAIWRLDA